ncbi:MAG: lipopolysaccharide biosynthesis protein [Pseudolabrys sp.]
MWRKLASQSLAIFGGRLLGAAVVFAVQALIARRWGAHVLGDYLVAVAAINIGAMVMPLGFQTVGAYFAAEYRAHEAGPSLRAFMRQAYGQATLAALGVALVGAAAFHVLRPSGPLAALAPPALVMAAATALVYLNGALLVGLKRPVTGLIADTLCRPMLALSGFLLAATVYSGATPLVPMLWWMALGYVAVAAAQGLAVLVTVRTIPATAMAARDDESRRWWRFALPWAVISLVTDFFFDIDLVVLTHMLGRDDLAVFGICARIYALLAFGVATIYTVTMPDILEAGARRNDVEFHRRIGDANLMATLLATVMAAAMFAIGPFLGLLFGHAFSSGAGPLGIMALGLVARAALGPASLVLSYHDRPYASLTAAAVALVGLLVGNLALVPHFGLAGAAVAALVATTAWSVALWVTARHHVHIDVSIVPRLKDLLVGQRAAQGRARRSATE